MIKSMTNLKLKNSQLKFLAAVGGADKEQTIFFSTFIKSRLTRLNFIQNLIRFSVEFALDGIDIDYEFPQTIEDKNNFAQLLDDIRVSFDVYGFILSIAVAPDRWRAEKYYDIERISKSVDFINLMTYDFHGSWDDTIGHHAQMYPHQSDSIYIRELNCASAVVYWISMGVSSNKINLGIPTYGNVFHLNDMKKHKIGDKSVNKTKVEATMTFNQFCEQKRKRWKQFFDWNYRVYYAINESEMKWFGFDHPMQVSRKGDLILDRNLSGAVIWSVDGDDSENKCEYEHFPLISSIFKTIIKSDKNENQKKINV